MLSVSILVFNESLLQFLEHSIAFAFITYDFIDFEVYKIFYFNHFSTPFKTSPQFRLVFLKQNHIVSEPLPIKVYEVETLLSEIR